jgi:serine/threonine protein kinase
MAQPTRYGEWEILERLGEGGQGTVFRVRKSSADNSQFEETIKKAIVILSDRNSDDGKGRQVTELMSIMRHISAEREAPLGALKVIHEVADKGALDKAIARMHQECEALLRFKHPSLVRLLGARPPEHWFVMEYFSRGTLSNHLNDTRDNVQRSLQLFRPLVEAVAALHNEGSVHRDIKPANVFVADDGHLVLGDFGLIANSGAAHSRLTDTYENVGSRDWMPGWAFGKRTDEVKSSFDVYSLGKLLWSMISGKQFLRLWYHHHPEFDLKTLFPQNASMGWATRILDKCIVEHEHECLKDAGELLNEVDTVIDAMNHGGQMPEYAPLRCIICGLGSYTEKVREDISTTIFACNHCGNAQTFHQLQNRPAWN